MLKVVPRDVEYSACLCNFAPKDATDPTVMIESCGEYLHTCFAEAILNSQKSFFNQRSRL